MSDNVKTYLRIRPHSLSTQFTLDKNSININGSTYSFDKIFKNATQQEVFEELYEDLLVSSLQGYNCTIFAYGQTGSGKTYTIQGNEQNVGLVQRSLGFLHKNSDLNISLSFIEVYNEVMMDLFEPKNALNIREDPFVGITVDNLSILESDSYEKSIDFYNRGIKTRRTSSTAMNKESSRSHSIFTIHISSNKNLIIKSSKLCFVDLAGSERLKDLEAEEVKVKETANINTSLLHLGKTIQKLSSEEAGHIGYRDSKLTFLLKNSLSGNCKLMIIGNVTLEYQSDSINTMQFLKRAKLVKNLAVANSDVSGNIEELKNQVRLLDMENQALKAKLSLINGGNLNGEFIPLSYQYDLQEMKRYAENLKIYHEELETLFGQLVEERFKNRKDIILELHSYYSDISQKRKENIENEILKKRKHREP